MGVQNEDRMLLVKIFKCIIQHLAWIIMDLDMSNGSSSRWLDGLLPHVSPIYNSRMA